LWNQVQLEEPGSFVFNTPNDQSRPGYLKMGWQILGKPDATFRYLPGAGLSRRKKWDKAVESLHNFSFNVLDQQAGQDHADAIRSHSGSQYYKWRYQQVPDRQYGFSTFNTHDGVVGFIYYLRNRRGFTELRICDEIVLETAKQNNRLLDKGMNLLAAQFAGCVVTRLCRQGEKGSRLLRPFIPNITLKLPEDPSVLPVDVMNMNHWHFEMGALELF
jgi:hypothetical protein